MSIFVSIACLLDPDIVNTIEDCLSKAKFPDKITIGVCYQKDYDKPDLLAPLEEKYKCIKVVRIDWKQAQGPMFARNKILSLIDVTDEDYFLQIDCHTRFFLHWDQKLLDQHNLSLQQSDNPIISYYPININNMKDPKHLNIIYHIATFRQVDTDGIKTSGRIIKVPDEPLQGIGVTTAMLFMPVKTVLDNPIDPNLPFALHSGEQLLYAIRLWTRGWDFFTPSEHILATEYITNRERIDIKYRSFLNRKAMQFKEVIWKKVQYLLGLCSKTDVPINLLTDDIDIWKEGNVRSLEEYYKMAGIYNKILELFPNNRLN